MRNITRLSLIASLLAASLALPMAQMPAKAQSAPPFYKDKQVQVVVGTNAGVGYDLYARLLVAHLGRHIPGEPSFVVRNMIGAGGLRAAEFVARIAPQDGLTIGSIGRGLPFEAMLGQNEINIDPSKFSWLGSMNREIAVAFSWHSSKVKTFADLRQNELLTPGTGAGADSEIMPLAFNSLAGARFKLIKGYKGTSEAALAVERGELDGIAYWSLGSLSTLHRHWIDKKLINILFHTGVGPQAALPGAPSIRDFARDPIDRAALDFILAREALGRPFFTAPAAPAERVAILRKGFADAMRDPALINDAAVRKLEISLVSGEEIDALLARARDAEPATFARLMRALGR
jgi:tripartite-type tricarboxylate transporter receptor subunit TctC